MRKNSEICLICGKTNFKNANSFTKHLRVHKISTKNYYLFYIDHNAGICKVCEKEVKFHNIDNGFPNLCRVCNNKRNPKRIQKIKETNIRKYGVENVSQVEEFKEKRKQTNLKRFGVEYSHQNPDIMKKCLDTWSKKYEGGHPGRDPQVKEKKKKTWQEKYGVDHVFQKGPIREKRDKTCKEKFGSKYPMCNLQVRKKFEKSMIEQYGEKHALLVLEIVEKVSGENHYNWLEDREQRFAPYTEKFFDGDFREQIRKEQKNINPMSGDTLEESAHLHHIDYDKTNDSRENLIFLNQSNHFKTNTNREHWKELLKQINQLYI